MATKWSELRERVPGVHELLETQPLRQLTERWNRTLVATGVRSFLQELKSDVERRRSEGHFPSLTEIARRAAQHLALLQQPTVRPVINATGQLLGPEWLGRPLADEALQQMVAYGRSFVSASKDGEEPCGAAAVLAGLAGAESATVTQSYAGAIWLVAAALAMGKPVFAARADVGDVEPGCSLADLLTSAGAILKEVGAVNRTTAADFETAEAGTAAMIVYNAPQAYAITGAAPPPNLEELVAIGRERDLVLVDTLSSASLVSELPGFGSVPRSAAASIAAGVNLAIVRGDGLVGGPACGIIVGDRELIRRIERHPMFAAWRAEAATAAALRATLELYGDHEAMLQAVPLFQLLSTSVENLRNRAERLAPQLLQAADVGVVEVVPTSNSLEPNAGATSFPSYAVSVTPTNAQLDALDKRLRNAPIPVIARRQGECLQIDLRTVFPRDDQRLAEIVAGLESPAIQDESAQPVGGA